MALTKTQVSQLYVSIFGRASEGAGNTYWQTEVEGMSATATAMLETPAAKEYFGTALDDNQAFIETIYKNTLNKTLADDEAGIKYWVDLLESGMSRGEVVAALIDAIEDYKDSTDPKTKAAYDQFNNRVDVSDYTADTLETIAVSDIDSTLSFSSALTVTADAATVTTAKAAVDKAAEPVGSKFVLTTTQDNLKGTDGNDTFYAYASQNVNGATTNTLSTGDMIDGGKGSSDKIISSMINDETVNNDANFAPMPIINNVEEIRIQALENKVSSTGTGAVGSELNQVILDADQITGETKYASDSSRADLVITNVDITSTQITNDIKLEMKDTQQNSDFEVYFDQTSLRANPDKVVSSAQVVIQVADGAQGTGTTTPLANMTFDLSFTQDGKTYSFDNIESTDGTYTGLVTAIQVALAAEGLTQYVVALGDTFNTFTTEAGKSVNLDYTGNYVTITDSEGTAFSNITFAPEQKAGSEVAILLAQSNVNTDSVTTSDVIQSTITLDNVGRGSNGGEVIIGSTSNSVNSTGVERINVIVENSSVVHDISSTNNALKEITLTNGTVKGDFVLTNKANYNLGKTYTYDNVDTDPDFENGLTSITATNFDGNIFLGTDALGKDTADTQAIVNLGSLSAAVNGNVTYNALLNDDASHRAVTGAGDDTHIIELSGTSSVTVNTGNGTNSVTLTETAAGVTKATITGGTGVDTIKGGSVAITVDAGAGNDVIYAENTGDKAVFIYDTTALTTATAATNASPNAVINQGVEFLYNVQVQVTLNTDGKAAAATEEGFESGLVTIKPESGYLTSQADVNKAIVSAINDDAVLSKIAKATIVNGDVIVTYLVDGVQVSNGFDVKFFAPVTSIAGTTLETAIQKEFEDKYKDSGFFTTAGTTASAQQTIAINNANAVVETFSVAQNAVYTLDLTGAVLTSTGDTLMLDGYAIYTATAAGDNASTIFTAIDGTTVTVNGINYLVGGTATAVTLTEVVASTDAIVTPGTDGFAVTVSNGTNATDTLADQTTAGIAASKGTDSTQATVNVINGNEGDDFIVLSSNTGSFDIVEFTGYNQGNDTIVHFETGKDKLDFSAYLNGTISDSGSAASVVDHTTGTVVTTKVFTADGANLLNFNALGMAAGVTFDNMTTAQIETALEAAGNGTSIANTAKLVETTATSVLIVYADPATAANNDGEYKAYEISYANTAVSAANAKDFTVKLIGSFDLGDDANLATTDIAIL